MDLNKEYVINKLNELSLYAKKNFGQNFLVNDDIRKKEKVLYHSTDNKHLVELLDIEKTLVYFITSLKANDVVLEKLSKGNVITMYEEDFELLEDTLI